jgi:D-glycero-beta-D-manno-heptose-7-phosphate kinase
MVFAVDSRHRIDAFKGASLITPNEEEAAHTFSRESIDEDKILDCARNLRKVSEAKNLIITRGPFGMALVEKGRKGFLLPICGDTDIVDTTGAGDTVIAAATLTLAAGGNLMDAGIIATCAASVTIMQEGAAAASLEELRKEIEVFQSQVYGR